MIFAYQKDRLKIGLGDLFGSPDFLGLDLGDENTARLVEDLLEAKNKFRNWKHNRVCPHCVCRPPRERDWDFEEKKQHYDYSHISAMSCECGFVDLILTLNHLTETKHPTIRHQTSCQELLNAVYFEQERRINSSIEAEETLRQNDLKRRLMFATMETTEI